MKITIDTKEESPDSIRHIINLLSSIVDGNAQQNNVFGSNAVERPVNQGNIFDDGPKTESASGTGSSDGIFGNMFGDSLSTGQSEAPDNSFSEPKTEETGLSSEKSISINPMDTESSKPEEQADGEPESKENKIEIIEYD